MPPTRVELTALCVGEFLSIRHGFLLDLVQTSVDVGAGGKRTLSARSREPAEVELHYRDIVTVEYRRSPPQGYEGRPVGTFHLGLVNGRTFEYPTIEQGAVSIVEAIRYRTRIKAREV